MASYSKMIYQSIFKIVITTDSDHVFVVHNVAFYSLIGTPDDMFIFTVNAALAAE